jgi:iron(III) transport system substrate-binding protein
MVKWVIAVVVAVGLGAVLLGGCSSSESENVLVVYVSVDEPIARPVLMDFQKSTGIEVRIKTDAEGTKTAGLATAIEAERDDPRADVYWGNEPFYTINLAEKGLLQKYESPRAAKIPAMYKDPQGRWAGTALRVRVMAVSMDWTATRPAAGDGWPPLGLADLAAPRLKGRIAMARPSVGTTGGHVAAIFTALGDDKATQLFKDLKKNGMVLLGGNSEVAKRVGSGRMLAGLTDNDDVEATLLAGGRLTMVLPDQDPAGIGTLLVPCTVGMVANAKHSRNARHLVDYLLSKEVERRLLEARFARYSVFDIEQQAVKAMKVDYAAVARKLPDAIARTMRIMTADE